MVILWLDNLVEHLYTYSEKAVRGLPEETHKSNIMLA